MLGRPAAKPVFAAGRRLPGRNSQNSNYARRFSQGFSDPYRGGRVRSGGDTVYRMECSRVLDKSSKTSQNISVLYDIFTLGCSTFDLNENGTSSIRYHTVRRNYRGGAAKKKESTYVHIFSSMRT